VNGVLKSDVTEDGGTRDPMAAEGPMAINDKELLVGRYNASFSGIIDEVAIYSRALTVAEINQDMNNGVLGTSSSVSPVGRLITRWAKIKNQH
jgi:hypothetical protein